MVLPGRPCEPYFLFVGPFDRDTTLPPPRTQAEEDAFDQWVLDVVVELESEQEEEAS